MIGNQQINRGPLSIQEMLEQNSNRLQQAVRDQKEHSEFSRSMMIENQDANEQTWFQQENIDPQSHSKMMQQYEQELDKSLRSTPQNIFRVRNQSFLNDTLQMDNPQEIQDYIQNIDVQQDQQSKQKIQRQEFTFDNAVQKMEELQNHLQNLENFRQQYFYHLQLGFGEKLDEFWNTDLINNPQFTELIDYISGIKQNEDLDRQIKTIEEQYNQLIGQQLEGSVLTSNHNYQLGSSKKSKFDSSDQRNTEMFENFEFQPNHMTTIAEETFQDHTGMNFNDQSQMWDQIKSKELGLEDKLDFQSEREKWQKKQKKSVQFQQYCNNFPQQDPSFLFYNLLEGQAKKQLSLNQKGDDISIKFNQLQMLNY